MSAGFHGALLSISLIPKEIKEEKNPAWSSSPDRFPSFPLSRFKLLFPPYTIFPLSPILVRFLFLLPIRHKGETSLFSRQSFGPEEIFRPFGLQESKSSVWNVKAKDEETPSSSSCFLFFSFFPHVSILKFLSES